MRFLKKLKKSRQPSQQPASPGSPTTAAAGAPDIGGELDFNVGPRGMFRSAEIFELIGPI